jgi:hypothetical protein
MESGNGYDLLWQVLSLLVSGFDPTLLVIIPTWFDGDVFKFAHSFHLYYWLQAKKGVLSDDRTQSATFLNSIQEPLYMDVITTLTTCIKNYSLGDEDGYLLPHLCVMGLVLQIYKHAHSRAQTVIPWVQHTLGWYDEYDFDVPIQGASWVAQTNGAGRDQPPPRDGCGGCPPLGPSCYPPCLDIQGGRDCRQPPPGAQCSCFARPNSNRGKYHPDIICDACWQSGHVAANCNVLAIALVIEKYKQDIPDNKKEKIKSEWLT